VTRRGKILRDTNFGPGLVAIDGQHFQFALEGVWKGEIAPQPGMTVEAAFSGEAKILSLTPVPEGQPSNEQADPTSAIEKEPDRASAGAGIRRLGAATLIATALLIVGWFFLSAFSIQTFAGKAEYTFWQSLGFLNSANGFEAAVEGRGTVGAGFYGFLALIALLGPYLPVFWKDQRAPIASALPFLFMLMAGLLLRSSLNTVMGPDVGGPLGDFARQARDEAMKAVSLSLGSYISLVVSLYLAGSGLKKFLLSRALDTEEPTRSQQAAA
jgi:hypothetical protein